MSKESQAAVGEPLKPPGTWKPRKGKTQRDKETGAWANRLANRAERANENRSGPKPKAKKR